MTEREVRGEGDLGETAKTVSINSLSSFTRLSFRFLEGAVLFAKSSYEIEYPHTGKFNSETHHRHRIFVLGSIINTVTYLEALINEQFVIPHVNLSADNSKQMTEKWGTKDFSRKPMLEKYEEALKVTNKKPFDKSRPPYQEVKILLDLRDEIVHYKPVVLKWSQESNNLSREGISKRRQSLEHQLTTRLKLDETYGSATPLGLEAEAIFPEICLRYKCAKWAIESSIKFTDEFFSKMGLPSNLENFKQKLELPEPPKHQK